MLRHPSHHGSRGLRTTGLSTIGGAKAPPQPGVTMPPKTSQFTDAKASPQLGAKAHHRDDATAPTPDSTWQEKWQPIPSSFKPGESVVLAPGTDLPISYMGDVATRRTVSDNDPWIVKRRTSGGYYSLADPLSVRVPPFSYLTLPAAVQSYASRTRCRFDARARALRLCGAPHAFACRLG